MAKLKPLNLTRARPLISSLFRKDRLQFLEKGSLKSVFFNEEIEARFYGQTWEEILEEAQMERFNQIQKLNL